MQNELDNLMNELDRETLSSALDKSLESEESWQDRTGLDFEGLCGAIETIIFMSDKPVSLLRLKGSIDEELPLKSIHKAIQRLQEDYEKKIHGIRLVEVAEGYQFRTKAIYSKFVQELFKIKGLTLTPSCLEVLSIIAYRQPVSKFDVEKIRGVDSSHLIRTLMDKRLVKLIGRSHDLGRPSIYGTTTEFLDVFNLPDLNSLPPEYELDSIIESKKVDISSISNIRNNKRENFIFDDVEELEELASKIRSISTSTDFTKEINGPKKVDHNQPRKNAFELLESHIDKNLIQQSMIIACQSDTLGIPEEIKIIRDLLGPFANAPLEEDFEMIDLETGETIQGEEEFDSYKSEDKITENELKLETQVLDSDGIAMPAKALFADEEHDDLSQLESALDAAFDKFKNSQKIMGDNQENLADEVPEMSKNSNCPESRPNLDENEVENK